MAPERHSDHRIRLEVCVEDHAGLTAAVAGGADRIELCAALSVGGLTPSAGLMAAAGKAPIPVVAMIRPRAGSFVWSEAEICMMEAEIGAARAAGLAGVVIGAADDTHRLDAACLARLARSARGMEIVLHRVIDLVPEAALPAALRLAADLSVCRILSSGGARRAADGLDRLQRMTAAVPEISVMPGSGVGLDDLPRIRHALPGLRDIHASCSVPVTQDVLEQADPVGLGFAPPNARRTDAAKVAALRAALGGEGSKA